MKYTAAEIADILPGEKQLSNPSSEITELAFDSRKIFLPEKTIFFALRTSNGDGHHYIEEAIRKGVKNLVISDKSYLKEKADLNYFLVNDVLASLQLLAARHRNKFQIPVVAITGSNGKTSTKEWLFETLSKKYRVRRNPKSFNSQIGVPLSIWNLNPDDEIGIFEAGISKPGEMKKLQKIIRPTHGLLSNIGPAHDEGFKSREEKLFEKLSLFEEVQTLVYCRDQEFVHKGIHTWHKKHPDVRLFSWGVNASADIRVAQNDRILTVEYQGRKWTLKAPFLDRAGIENLFHLIALLISLHLDPADFLDRIQKLEHLPLRLELKNAINNSILIYDCYNNDLRSLQIALEYQNIHGAGKEKSVILSDILESGIPPDKLYEQLARLLQENDVKKVVGIGPEISQHLPNLLPQKIQTSFYSNIDDFKNNYQKESFQKQVILLKGARKFTFERIGPLLEEQTHGTRLHISLEALRMNYNLYRSLLSPDVNIMVMVKALAYGTGMDRVASVLQYHHADYLAVAYADEGVSLRKAGIRLPIMVMNTADEAMERLLEHHLEPQIFNLSILKRFLAALEVYHSESGSPYPIHLKIDTGMHRLGFDESDIPQLLNQLKDAGDKVRVQSIFSHLASAENPAEDDFSRIQIQRFKEISEKISHALGYQPLRHLANSSAIVRFPEAHFDMVRLGIGLYGIDPSGLLSNQLQTVAALYTNISQIRKIPAGEGIGYGSLDPANHERKIAVVGIGYADGYSRRFSSGRGYMLVNGQPAPVTGNVCMDMTLLDITGIDAKEGDLVEVFGENLKIEDLASKIETIPYELLANLSERIKRVYLEE